MVQGRLKITLVIISYLEQNKRAEWREGLVFCQPCGRRGWLRRFLKGDPSLKDAASKRSFN